MSQIIEIFRRSGNRALDVNPPSATIDIHLSQHGSDWLWAAFSVFSLLTLVHALFFGFTSSKNRTLKKALFVGPLFTNFVMAITYFTYASNLGYAGVPVEFHHVTTSRGLGVRQIFYVKFIGWFLSWPFALYGIEVATHTLDLSSMTSTGETFSGLIRIVSNLFVKVFATEVFVLGLLIGAVIESSYKWGYFTFAVVGELFAISLIIIALVGSIRSTNSNKISSLLIAFQLIVWILYPIAWGLSEGGNYIQPSSEAAFYGVLDVITFAFIPTLLTFRNASGLDEDVFHNFHLAKNFGNEKLAAEVTPRASGDTAVPVTQTTGVEDPAETV